MGSGLPHFRRAQVGEKVWKMTPEMQRRLEIAEYNLKEAFEAANTNPDSGAANHVYVNMARAYMHGVEMAGRGMQDVDGYALNILAALAMSACEKRPMPEYAMAAARLAVERYAFYLPEPQEPQQVFRDMTNPDAENGEGPVYGRDVGRDGINPAPTPFMDAVSGRLGGDLGIISPRTPEPPEGQPYAPRSGAQLFGEVMLQANGRYDMLEGMKFPPDWSPDEIENYIKYKRELEARHLAAGQRVNRALRS